MDFRKHRPKTSAAYQCVRDEKPIEKVEKVFQEAKKEPAFAYGIEFACDHSLFKQHVWTSLAVKLAKTGAEDQISMWNSVAAGKHTHYIAKVAEQEEKTLNIGWNNQSATPFDLDPVTPQAKDNLNITEAFIPVRPAIQMGTILGLPTEGYLYHFLDGKLLTEYRCKGEKNHRFVVTRSQEGAMNPEPIDEQTFEFILALWKRGEQVVTDQYLFYSLEPLDDDAIKGVDEGFLNEHGIKLDMDKLLPLTEGPGVRKCHIIEKGDTLIGVAKKHGLTLEELIDLNPHWKGNERALEINARLYLEEVSDYNHGDDVGYPSTSALIGKGLFSIGRECTKRPFPVVRITTSPMATYSALAPVRYAIDIIDKEKSNPDQSVGCNPPKEDTLFPGGIFRSEHTPYTLRQLRNGWVYIVSQDLESSKWSVEEYQALSGEFYRFIGETEQERLEAEAEKPKSHLLYLSDRPCFIGFASQRWTQLVQDLYTGESEESDTARTDWLRDVNGKEHLSDINTIEDNTADVGEEDIDIFEETCAAPSISKDLKSHLLSPLKLRNQADYQYQVPTLTQHNMIALDDPIGDMVDLYMRLSRYVAPTVKDKQTQRKLNIASTVRSLVRVPLDSKITADLSIEEQIQLESDVDYVLGTMNHLEASQKLLDGAHGRKDAFILAQSSKGSAENKLKNPEILNRLSNKGLSLKDVEALLPDYQKRLRAHGNIDWLAMDEFYAKHSKLQNECIAGIQHHAPILLDAFYTLGNDPRRFGYDISSPVHLTTLHELMDSILNDVYLSEELSESVKDKVDELSSNCYNLIGLTPYFYNVSLYASVNDLSNKPDFRKQVGEVYDNGRLPFSAFIAAFDDIIGFDSNSKLFQYTKSALVPIENTLNKIKGALTSAGDQMLTSMSSVTFRVASRNMGSKIPAVRESSTAAILFIQNNIYDLDIKQNKYFRAHHRELKAKIDEINKLKKALKGLKKGSKAYNVKSNLLKNTEKNLRGMELNITDKDKPPMDGFLQARNKISNKLNTLGRWDTVVSVLNLVNTLNQVEALQYMHGNASEADIADQQLTVAYSAAWFINAVAGTARSMMLSKVLGKNDLLENSLRALANKSSSLQLAKSYITASLLAGTAGIIAIGLEGWQTYLQHANSTDSTERILLKAKGIGLAAQGVGWAGLLIQVFRTRFLGLAVGSVLNGWILAFNFWGALLYLAATVFLILTKKLPLEAWLADCVWGIDPDTSLTPQQEFKNLIAILHAPKIENMSLYQTSEGVYHHILITIPNSQPGEKIWLGLSQGFSSRKGDWLTKQKLEGGLSGTLVEKLQQKIKQKIQAQHNEIKSLKNADEIESMQQELTALQKRSQEIVGGEKGLTFEEWSQEDGSIVIRLTPPKPLRIFSETRYREHIEHLEQLNIYIKREDTDPYDDAKNNKLYNTYIQRIIANANQQEARVMAQEEASKLPDIQFIELQVPNNE
ncbi:hypothetical protein BS333_20565 [Vibrio azureus]|uniref:LysM domain-containing protein n=1 Tax=Vibrio azureus NBRC 104587 TaxID=1219077 RepID=U3AUL5_9VIBR|nr:LysM peptidoglycan-binding domain-containing protein [Vibrio azureus]AUI88681.1 hypothetical protein BS333_20565 [Vibrio azureus]GAD76937.1 hypothetical protein VAZ01S_056_00190 [Vibrio azureus NBRC 104587]